MSTCPIPIYSIPHNYDNSRVMTARTIITRPSFYSVQQLKAYRQSHNHKHISNSIMNQFLRNKTNKN